MQPFYLFQIITPQGLTYEGEVVHALIPSERGFVGVLANHAPYITSSAGGKLQLRERNSLEKTFRIGEGFFEVTKNKAVILTQSCEEIAAS